MVTFVLAATGLVVMGKVADLAPAAMVTLVGTVAAAVLELARVTVTLPPLATGPVKVTVPVLLAPPVTLLGERLTEESAGVVTVSVVLLVTPA